MKLIIAIVSDDLIREVTDHLMDKNIRSTKLASSGGFLKNGNSTILIGSEDNEVDEKIMAIREAIEKSKNKSKVEDKKDANIFVVPIKSMKRM
ncbi:cyclic-di-AMP receptor [Citroniella saccharovorans]|uniref:Cyclic-di-AMP receptor n=1 Tax=Citroniella saccharovorans TaxID=2053367 RepID=A0AAW9MSJ3_9FIRM|nr:cyclic-di-AMP receptor [Citroniella saccharovorans]MEB3430144.1 cyclic-di-AMP receptor [Citroniella saccharovorans]